MSKKIEVNITVDKEALRFVFANGNGKNLFWRDLFLGIQGRYFHNEVMDCFFRLYNECVENDITYDDEEGEGLEDL